MTIVERVGRLPCAVLDTEPEPANTKLDGARLGIESNVVDALDLVLG